MSLSPLAMEISKCRLLKERLMQIYPLDDDDETLADTLEGITNVHEMIAAIIRSALVDEALYAGLRSRLEEMKQRLARFELRGTKKRQLALEAMTEVGFKKLEQPDFTASLRAGVASLVVVSDDLIPETYWVPQPSKLDRQSLLSDLKRGGEVPGAKLDNPEPILAVRTK
jgi:Siphovirus Gp157